MNAAKIFDPKMSERFKKKLITMLVLFPLHNKNDYKRRRVCALKQRGLEA